MKRLSSNFAANVLGVASMGVAQIVFIPIYIRLLGVESYALVGVLFALTSVAQLLDLGIGATISREVARYSVRPEASDEARHFVRTFEAIYWALALLVGGILVLGAPLITAHLLGSSDLPSNVIRAALLRIALVCALQFPVAFYTAAFRGMQRQVASNVVRALNVLLANGVGVAVLLYVSRDVVALFDTFAIVKVLHVATIALLFWRAMPAGPQPMITPPLVRRTLKFTLSVTVLNVVGVAVTQLDKIIVTWMMPLRMAGYYMIGSIVGSALLVLMTPLFDIMFPEFSRLVASGEESPLRALYHRAVQLSAVLFVPVAAVIVFFAHDIIWIWTGLADVAQHAAPIAALLITGFVLNGLMDIPYALQLAYGKTSIGLTLAAVQLAVFLPMLYFMTRAFGAVGAATAWPAMNLVYLAVGIPLTHRHLLRGASWRWLTRDVLPPAIAAVAVAGLLRIAIAESGSRFVLAVQIAAALLAVYCAAAFAAEDLRAIIRARMRSV